MVGKLWISVFWPSSPHPTNLNLLGVRFLVTLRERFHHKTKHSVLCSFCWWSSPSLEQTSRHFETHLCDLQQPAAWLRPIYKSNVGECMTIRLWRVPATLPYPDLIFTTRTLPGKVLKISGFRVVPIHAVSTQDYTGCFFSDCEYGKPRLGESMLT